MKIPILDPPGDNAMYSDSPLWELPDDYSEERDGAEEGEEVVDLKSADDINRNEEMPLKADDDVSV